MKHIVLVLLFLSIALSKIESKRRRRRSQELNEDCSDGFRLEEDIDKEECEKIKKFKLAELIKDDKCCLLDPSKLKGPGAKRNNRRKRRAYSLK